MTFIAPRTGFVASLLLSLAACGPDHTPAALAPEPMAGQLRAALKSDGAYLIAPTTSVTGDQPGVCFDVRNGSRAAGALVQLWDCDGGEQQTFTRDGNNLRIFDDLCLAVAEGREVPGGGVQLEPCDKDFLNQGWIFDETHMHLEGTELCLEVVNGIITRGAGMQLQPCSNEAEGQRFSFTEARKLTGPGTPGSRYRAPADDNEGDGDGNSKTHSGDKKDNKKADKKGGKRRD